MLVQDSIIESVRSYCRDDRRALKERLASIIQVHYDALFVSSDWQSVEFDDFLGAWVCINSQAVWYISSADLQRIHSQLNQEAIGVAS